MPHSLYQCEEFGTPSPAGATVIFICPFDTPIERVRFAVRRLCRNGHQVMAYQTSGAVFRNGDPAILPELIAAVREDIKTRIAKLSSQDVNDVGFFGSSLGSFILYNCIGREIPELRWGVFNTGGDISRGVWQIPDLKQRHVERGWSLSRLEQEWAGLQWPDFGRLDGCRFVFVGSRRDKVAPLGNISPYLESMRRAGARVSVREVPAVGHKTTVIMGLWKAPRLIRMVTEPMSSRPRSRFNW